MLYESIRLLAILENYSFSPFQHGPSVIVPKFGITFLNFQDKLTSARILFNTIYNSF